MKRVGPSRVVTIIGARRTGKTHMLIALALREIRAGRFVIYETHDAATASDKHSILYRRLESEEMTRAINSNSGRGIWHTTGGVVLFRSGRGQPFRGAVDTYIVDDAPLDDQLEIRHPTAWIYHAPEVPQ